MRYLVTCPKCSVDAAADDESGWFGYSPNCDCTGVAWDDLPLLPARKPSGDGW